MERSIWPPPALLQQVLRLTAFGAREMPPPHLTSDRAGATICSAERGNLARTRKGAQDGEQAKANRLGRGGPRAPSLAGGCGRGAAEDPLCGRLWRLLRANDAKRGVSALRTA